MMQSIINIANYKYKYLSIHTYLEQSTRYQIVNQHCLFLLFTITIQFHYLQIIFMNFIKISITLLYLLLSFN